MTNETNSPIDYVIDAIKAGKKVIDIFKGLRGRKLAAEEKWYIEGLIRSYETDRIIGELSREYREGTKRIEGGIEKLSREQREGANRIVAKIENAEEHIKIGFNQIGEKISGLEKATYVLQTDLAKYAVGTQKLIEGLLLGGYKAKRTTRKK